MPVQTPKTTPPKMNVESFNLDHRAVRAPYVRLADRKVLPQGDVLVKYDVRFCQPNAEFLPMPAVHSIEHLFAEYSRNRADNIIDFSPMGCQTGFYLLLSGLGDGTVEPDYDAVLDLIEGTCKDILDAPEVPAANDIQCGWGTNHSLSAAKRAIVDFLNERDEWDQVMDA